MGKKKTKGFFWGGGGVEPYVGKLPRRLPRLFSWYILMQLSMVASAVQAHQDHRYHTYLLCREY